MKFKTWFTIDQKASPPGLYRLICGLARSSVRVDDVRIEARTGETLKLLKIAMFVALCRAVGMKRSRLGDLGTYGYMVIRQYEQKDLDPCELLFMYGLSERQVQFQEKRDVQGRLLLHAQNLERLDEFGQVNHRIVVSTQARQALEAAGFQGLAFHDVAISGGPAVEACWELATTVTLPKLANTERLMCYGTGPTDKVEIFTGDYSRMVFIDDPPYASGEMHYRRSDLRALGQFDVAETFEHLGIPQRSFVISQRLYRFLLHREIQPLVCPVRTDPD